MPADHRRSRDLMTHTATSPALPLRLLRLAGLAALAASALCAAGCADDPPIKLRYELSKGPAQECAADCNSTQLHCKSVLSVRIIDPAHPEQRPYLSVCRSLVEKRPLCQIAQVRLVSEDELPRRRLAIQVALYNADDLEIDSSGDPICPQDQPYAANGYAAPSKYRPAIAGMGYYTPGEEETVVPLGCADVTLVQTLTCQGKNLVKLTASADDFDSGVYLQPPVADAVELKVGEPEQTSDGFEIPLTSITKLERVVNSFPAAWSGERDRAFESSVCLIVQEDVAQSTPTVTCRLVNPGDASFDLRGLRLTRSTLQQVLTVLGEQQFPKRGLVVGMVVDHYGQPLPGVTVTPSLDGVSVEYLSAGRDRLIGSATSTSGIFISRNAPFTTSWSAPGTSTAYGGLIADKVTVVILQADPP